MSPSSFRCQYCRKRFDKESTQKRHLYYCRAKLEGTSPVRRVACTTCASSEARCGRSVPRCYRCQARGFTCSYIPSPVSAIQKETVKDLVVKLQRNHEDHHENGLFADEEFEAANHQEYEVVPLASELFWHTTVGSGDRLGGMRHRPTSTLSSSTLAILPTSNAFADRLPDSQGQSLTRRLVLSFLASYVKGFSDGLLLPFIHWSQELHSIRTEDSSLSRCRALVRRFFNAISEDQRQVLSLIQQEAEHNWFQHQDFDNWELLGSIQAMLLYALLRATQTDTSVSDFDLPFLICLNHVSQAMAILAGTQEVMQQPGSDPSDFKTWVFYEARRRTVVVFRLLNMVVNISDAVSCFPMPGFVIVPLPEEDGLWEARRSGEWSRTFARQQNTPSVFGMADNGGLVKLQKEGNGVFKGEEEWSEWLTISGKLGFLIAAAATLLS